MMLESVPGEKNANSCILHGPAPKHPVDPYFNVAFGLGEVLPGRKKRKLRVGHDISRRTNTEILGAGAVVREKARNWEVCVFFARDGKEDVRKSALTQLL